MVLCGHLQPISEPENSPTLGSFESFFLTFLICMPELSGVVPTGITLRSVLMVPCNC